MKETANTRKTTTICCDKSTLEFVAAEAKRLNIPQRKFLALLVDSYRHNSKRSATSSLKSLTEPTAQMPVDMETFKKEITTAIQKEVNRVIGFQKEQEKIFLTHIVKKVDSIEKHITELE